MGGSAVSANDFESAVFEPASPAENDVEKLAETLGQCADERAAGRRCLPLFGSKGERDAAQRSLERDRVFKGCRILPSGVGQRPRFQRVVAQATGGTSGCGNELEDSWPPRSRYER